MIARKRLQVEAPLVTEFIVETLPADLHRLQQAIRRGARETPRLENSHRATNSDASIEFFWPAH
jgi:hypothetical protein